MAPARKFSFVGRIHKVGINPCVDLSIACSRHFGTRGYIRVIGTVNRCRFQATLVPLGHGRHRLFLNQQIRDAAKVGTGDRVAIKLQVDTTSRDIEIPQDLRAALAGVPEATAAFGKKTLSRRREILRWIAHAKRPETRQRRIDKAVATVSRKVKQSQERENGIAKCATQT
jgi:hypothetical protein